LLTVEAAPPVDAKTGWSVQYQFASQTGQPSLAAQAAPATDGSVTFTIPISQPHPPGITGQLRILTRR
jgi:hypothetical protein